MTISRRSVLGAGLAGPLLASPFLISPARAQRAAGIIRYGLSAFPPNLQPWVSTGASAGTVKMLINRSLVSYDSCAASLPNPGRAMPMAPGFSSCARAASSITASRSRPTT